MRKLQPKISAYWFLLCVIDEELGAGCQKWEYDEGLCCGTLQQFIKKSIEWCTGLRVFVSYSAYAFVYSIDWTCPKSAYGFIYIV